MSERDEDEERVWHAAVAALRSKGATHTEAVDGASIVLHAYRHQRGALASQAGVEVREASSGPDPEREP